MVAGCDWPLASLQAHRGAEMVYRISRRGDGVRLEGRAGCRTCLFETARPDGAARPLPAERPEDLIRPIVSPAPCFQAAALPQASPPSMLPATAGRPGR